MTQTYEEAVGSLEEGETMGLFGHEPIDAVSVWGVAMVVIRLERGRYLSIDAIAPDGRRHFGLRVAGCIIRRPSGDVKDDSWTAPTMKFISDGERFTYPAKARKLEDIFAMFSAIEEQEERFDIK